MKSFKKKKCKRKCEFFLIIFFIIVLFLFDLYILDCFFSPIHPNYEYEFKEVVVSQDERLWDIAENELKNNSYYKGEDVRQVIYEITKDNNLSSANYIYPGQVIKIRIKKDELNSTDQSLDNSSINY